MLILSRSTSESTTLIDERTGEVLGRILLVEVTGKATARLGFELPQWIKIVRDEAPQAARRHAQP